MTRSRSRPAPPAYHHPVNIALAQESTAGTRLADRATEFIGSWRFIVIQTVIVVVWVAGNVYLVFNFDPYPFILLNLAFSTQAAYAAPLILLSTNRQAARDRMVLEHAAELTAVEEKQNEALLRADSELTAQIGALERRLAETEERILARLPAGPGPG